MTIGERIKAARKALHLSQEELGAACHTTKQTIFKYESGAVTNIPRRRLEQLAAALHLSLPDLLGVSAEPVPSQENAVSVPELFGRYVFNENAMRQYVAATAFEEWKASLRTGRTLSPGAADLIAEGMKNWALANGATHYTHWFQPMTGITAEKHDSFLSTTGGRVLMDFSGKELVKGESDASSLPSGGLRATFEARGYTAWDPTSFAFIKDATLCIPTVFCSYGGDALDKKTPLLRSCDALNRQALRVLRLLGDTQTARVTPQVGAEQEYFLVDAALCEAREDLKLCGRTLFGAKPPKGQELGDHYFGVIPPRVAAFMRDLDETLWQFGVPSKTEHNEAAPAQHEMAVVYTDVNTACDHNQLVMEIMKKVAAKHGLVCLLHEKPFAWVNGSGKHNNWSLATDGGENLFSPGKTPSKNARFLLFLAAFLAAVDDYPEQLRISVAGAGNDHRLGMQEAPPAILSVFLGEELEAILDSVIGGTDYIDRAKRPLRIGVDVLPTIPQDTTDRNRTSPVAFTGNKFEFRMPGASQSIAGANITLNTIMAEELRRMADALEKDASPAALHELIRRTFAEHRRILFSGNSYSAQWPKDAEKRGLPNFPCTADALPEFVSPKSIALYTDHGVFSESELRARHAIHMDSYCNVIRIEAATLVDMVRHDILAAASRFCGDLCNTVQAKKATLGEQSCRVEMSLAGTVSELNDRLLVRTSTLKTVLDTMNPNLSGEEQTRYCHDRIFAAMISVRETVDALETVLGKEYWPYPTYYDLLFSV